MEKPHHIPAASLSRPALDSLAATVPCLPPCDQPGWHTACGVAPKNAFTYLRLGSFCLFLISFVMLIVVAPLMLLCHPHSRPEEPPTWSGYMGKMFQAATNYLPAQVSGMMNQDRAFATVRLNVSGQRNICALSTYVLTSVSPLLHQLGSRHSYLCRTPPRGPLILCWCLQSLRRACLRYLCERRSVWTCGAFLIRIQKLPRLLVTTSDGHLYIYNLDPQDGGECVLIKKHR